MFMFDVETLGTESNSVLLSLACIHFTHSTFPTYQELKDSAFFVKFDAREQIEKYNRRIEKAALKWWERQCTNAQKWSLRPSEIDVSLHDGLNSLSAWVSEKNDTKSFVWARGTLDQIVLQSCEKACQIDTIFDYNRWRDVRTAIDIFTNSTNGYCDVEHPDFLYERDVTKHNPIDDCAFDVMMLIYGKEKT